ncbi:uncharacterized protein LOC131426849 [Malaya genurostris]|uniref:uncharacterized protein LOC131426849 n=1 Tax=Malaya genurostris TaxID=325434 RepID=UPI0026F3C16A|nr:uncharacterized protein LOC131426849 [Malaya genurostris]
MSFALKSSSVYGFIVLIAVSFYALTVVDHRLIHAFKHIQPWSDDQLICSNQNQKLLSLFNLLCNTTQTVSIVTRDACYGCFFRAGVLPSGQTQLLAISQCATLYLTNSSYASCATGLAAIATGLRQTTVPLVGINCYTGYCEFVQCVRRINSNILIDQCILQTLNNRDLNVQAQRIAFYTNATSCILARARCNSYNPITGELQTAGAFNKPAGSRIPDPLSNSLQITPRGDIRIISFSSRVVVADLFCSSQTMLDQSTYGDSVC